MPDKWDQYAVKPAAAPPPAVQPTDVQKTANDPWQRYAAPQTQPGPIDRFQNLVDRASTVTPEELQPHNALTKASPLLNSIGNQAAKFGAGVIGSTAGALAHPVNAVKGLVKSVEPDPGAAGWGERLLGPGGATAVQLVRSAIKAPAETAGSLVGGALTGEAVGPVVDAVRGAPEMVRGKIAGDVTTPKPGMTLSPAQRYAAAQRVGANLDAAEATQNPLLGTVKKVGENSLVGGPVYDAAKARNTGAVGEYTDRLLNEMSPHSGEAAGARVQDLLKNRQQLLHDMAEDEFKNVDREYGPQELSPKGYKPLQTEARNIASENAAHWQQFPSLVPKNVRAIVSDASKFGPHNEPLPLTQADKEWHAWSKEPIPPKYGSLAPPTVSDAIKLRSGIQDVYRNNPEIVKSASDAALERLVKAAHEGVLGELPPPGRASWEAGNDYWKTMKNTFDNPSSPFYDAVRTPNPSKLVTGVGARTPENVRLLASHGGEEARGIAQRGVTEDLLRHDREGGFNYPTFGRKFENLSPDYRSELFGAREPKLQDLATTANVLTKDFNPSGSGKLAQKVGEGMAMVPMLGAPLLQYPAARMMTSPRAVNWLMAPKPVAPLNGMVLPAAGALTSAAARDRR